MQKQPFHGAALVALVAAMSLMAGVASPIRAQDSAGLHFVAAVNEYYGVEYVPPPMSPAALDVVFAGEPVQLRFTIGNRNSTAEALTTHEMPLAKAFSLTPIRLPDGAAQPSLVARPAGRIRAQQFVSDVAWGDYVVIPAHGTVTFNAYIDTAASTPAGIYEVEITPQVPASAKINGLGTMVRYEVRRPSTAADEAEQLRRRMMREYYHDRPAAAEAACNALLEKYPASATAYRIKAQLAVNSGRVKEALDDLERARNLLASGQDQLWTAQHPARAHVQRAVTDITEQMDAIVNQRTPRVH